MARSIYMQLRLNQVERDFIRCLARREGMNASEFVRLAVREAGKARGIPAVGVAELYEKYPSMVEVKHDLESERDRQLEIGYAREGY